MHTYTFKYNQEYKCPSKLPAFPSFYNEEEVYHDSWFDEKPNLIQKFLNVELNDKYIIIKNARNKGSYLFANYLCANLIPTFKAKGSFIYIETILQTFNNTDIDQQAILSEMVIQLHLFKSFFQDTVKSDKEWAEEFKEACGTPENYVEEALAFCRTELSEEKIANAKEEADRRYACYTSSPELQAIKIL